MMCQNHLVGIVVEYIVIGMGGPGLDYRAGQIKHCHQGRATAAMFLCCPPRCKVAEMGADFL